MNAHAPQKVLIANRGEIAVRVARACADHGYTSVAVYADGDADALHVRLADEAHGLGGVTAAETYLDAEKLIAAARASGATFVHPGYGFLSESADFARAVRDAGLTWVGPSPESIELLGDKISARRLAESVGAPLIAGTTDPVADPAEAVAFAEQHGLPIAIKAAFGGGGRGMRVARRLDEVAELFESAGREAVAAFGRGECFIERYLERPRHVEAQVLADGHGNVVVLGTRDCSLQRRSQKLVEEAPAPFLTDEQRERVHAAARDICAAADYQGAATVEFLLGADGLLSFLEVNTRLQVEHPVTEETTGVDIVGEQLRIAAGLPLSITETPTVRGHSIEFRINAEDPARGFLPVPGAISLFAPPTGPGVRLDTGVESGSEVSGRFDSMMAKLVVTGVDRDAALARARRALSEFRIEGVATVLPFHRAVLADADFIAAEGFAVHTQWIETTFADRTPPQELAAPPVEPDVVSSWIEIDGRRLGLRLPAALAGSFATGVGTASGSTPTSAAGSTTGPGASDAAADGDVLAPMAGTLVRWAVEDGAAVEQGDTIAVLEAMKMETTVTAPVTGTVDLADDAPSPGDPVSPTTVLARIIPA